ncbi:MAG: polysaccharide deacetylase family protein [Bacteroidia bacterium]|nr:polysaccharide deacetylase family protein [Bacteroidia bacterium]
MMAGIGTIFMLHRVAPYEKRATMHTENLKFSPDELEYVISALKKQGKMFVSMQQLPALINNDKHAAGKFVAFTLDDGYTDNLEYAYPIFRKHNIPFCIYITNSFPNRTTNLWWFALENLIVQNNTLNLPGAGRVANRSQKEKDRNFLRARRDILSNHFRDPLRFLEKLGRLEFDLNARTSELCLTWQQVAELSRDPRVTIGCHTVNHFPLSRLSQDEARKEITDSKSELETRIGKPVNHFAFPFGSHREAGQREYNLAHNCGFQTIATSLNGHVHRGDHLNQLNRLFLYPLAPNACTLDKLMYRNKLVYVSYVKKYILGKLFK